MAVPDEPYAHAEYIKLLTESGTGPKLYQSAVQAGSSRGDGRSSRDG